MKILFSILLNASIIFIIWYLLNTQSYPTSVVISPTWIDSWKTYLFGWIILGLLNTFIKPILKILWLPLFFIYPIVSLLINAFILWLLQKIINNISILDKMTFEINWTLNFVIAVAIFTFLNILYSLIFNKK